MLLMGIEPRPRQRGGSRFLVCYIRPQRRCPLTNILASMCLNTPDSILLWPHMLQPKRGMRSVPSTSEYSLKYVPVTRLLSIEYRVVLIPAQYPAELFHAIKISSPKYWPVSLYTQQISILANNFVSTDRKY